MTSKKEKRLQNTLRNLLNSYKKFPEIEHISNISLPTKENIISLVEDIQVLLFPGFPQIFFKFNLIIIVIQKFSNVQNIREISPI